MARYIWRTNKVIYAIYSIYKWNFIEACLKWAKYRSQTGNTREGMVMCMIYKGVAYPFAFEFNNVPIRNELRTFRIVISDYREISQDFSGLCFENELKVTSDIRLHYVAFFEVVNKIVNITKESEQFYFANYGKNPKPMISVTDPDIISRFELRKNSKKSLDYYEQLKVYFEKPESIEGRPIDEQIDIFDSPYILLFAAKIKREAPDFQNFSFFRT